MTAKEIARNFWVWEDTKDRDMLQGMTWGQLKEFAEQLCREYQENIRVKIYDAHYNCRTEPLTINEIMEIIKNAPMPEI